MHVGPSTVDGGCASVVKNGGRPWLLCSAFARICVFLPICVPFCCCCCCGGVNFFGDGVAHGGLPRCDAKAQHELASNERAAGFPPALGRAQAAGRPVEGACAANN